jgi:hypothetical protein
MFHYCGKVTHVDESPGGTMRREVKKVLFCEILSPDSSITEHSCLLGCYGVCCVNSLLFTQQRNISDNFDLEVSRLPGSTWSKPWLIIILHFQILSSPHENAVDQHGVGCGLLGANKGRRSSSAQTTAKVNCKLHSQ